MCITRSLCAARKLISSWYRKYYPCIVTHFSFSRVCTQTHAQLLLCFQCLEQILLFTASPSTAESASPDSLKSLTTLYASVGSKLVADILSSHMRCIYSSLQTSQPMALVASAVKLLTAMVLQGPSAARDIQQSFNFGYKPLETLPSRTGVPQVSAEDITVCRLS